MSVAGWSALPPSGTLFKTAESKKEAEKQVLEASAPRPANVVAEASDGKAQLPLILKSDVTGSIEAIKHELEKIGHDRVSIRILSEGVGAVGEGDVKTAQVGNAVVVAFNVPTDAAARDYAERVNVPIESFTIIYELAERVAALVSERAPRITVEETLGEAKVLKAFSRTANKHVLGAKWVSGELSVGDLVKIDRRGIALGRGKLVNLQVARADVSSIKSEGEFGLQVETREDIAGGDTLQAFRMIES